MRQASDQEFVDRVLQGEVNAFTMLLERHKDLVFSICLRVLGNREEAEEAAQDCFLNAYRSLEKFRGHAAFSTWLYRIAYNTSVSRTRKKKFEWPGLDGDLLERMEDEMPDELSETEWQEEREASLRDTIKLLPERDQLLIELYYTRTLGMEEIGEITGLSVSNVKVRMHRIRKQLLNLLQGQLATAEEERE